MTNENIDDPLLTYLLNRYKEKYSKFPEITEKDMEFSLASLRRSFKPIPFLQTFFSQNYQLIQRYRLNITSCYNETYFLIHNAEKKDTLIIKDVHSCFGPKRSEYPKISQIENIYTILEEINSKIELLKIKKYANDINKLDYDSEEHYENVRTHDIEVYSYRSLRINEFINAYLELIK